MTALAFFVTRTRRASEGSSFFRFGTLGVCPHHLFLTENDVPRLRGYGIMKPGLKTAHDRDTLWQAVADGLVDVIESDHAPHTIAEKESDKPPYGVPGLETTLPLMLTAAAEGRVTLDQVIALVSTSAHRIWSLNVPPETFRVVTPVAGAVAA